MAEVVVFVSSSIFFFYSFFLLRNDLWNRWIAAVRFSGETMEATINFINRQSKIYCAHFIWNSGIFVELENVCLNLFFLPSFAGFFYYGNLSD